MSEAVSSKTPSFLLPAIAVALCGAMWGVFWLPLRWLDGHGVGSGWVSLSFNTISALAPLPWLLRSVAWRESGPQLFTGLLLGTAFSLYTVSLAMTDVLHAILLFYLTPVWSTLAGWMWYNLRMSVPRFLAIVFGLSGMALILGIAEGVPFPRNAGDWVALFSGMFWTAGTLRSFARPVPGVALPVFFFSAGGLASSAVILIIGGALDMPLARADDLWRSMPFVILFALVFFVPPNFLVLWAAQRIDPGRVGILLMGEVLIGSISAALLAGQPFGMTEFAGTALIVCAGLVEVMDRRSATTRMQNAP
jgi:drug/metabolite transporter (DMT)-like permease